MATTATVVPAGAAQGSLMDSITTNPLFTGGAGLMGVGVALSLTRRLVMAGMSIMRRRFISTLELSNEDPAYPWVLDFINKNSRKRANQLSVLTQLEQAESGKTQTRFFFSPGLGSHYMSYGSRWIHVERTRQDQAITKDDGRRTPLETVSLTTLGANPSFWREFLENAGKDALQNVNTGLTVYVPHGFGWTRFGKPRRKRPIDSVVLDKGIKELLCEDLDTFFDSQKWYTDRGIPYRRGYLFFGPPGTGKSSFISALAAHHGYSVCLLSLSDRSMDDARLNHLLNNTPAYSFSVLEDIDCAFVDREALSNAQLAQYQGATRVTMSGLLNAVDGVASSEERVLFMTTNYVERLDQALIRPGRVDVKQYFGNCTPSMLEQMFGRFFEGVRAEECAQFRKMVLALGRVCSPAAVQGHLLNCKHDPWLAIRDVGAIHRGH